MSVILAIQEIDIRRIVVQSLFRQIVFDTLSQKYPAQKGAAQSGSSGKVPA
jgi:hypothetical protein